MFKLTISTGFDEVLAELIGLGLYSCLAFLLELLLPFALSFDVLLLEVLTVGDLLVLTDFFPFFVGILSMPRTSAKFAPIDESIPSSASTSSSLSLAIVFCLVTFGVFDTLAFVVVESFESLSC